MKTITQNNNIFFPKRYSRKPHILWSAGVYLVFLLSNIAILSYGLNLTPEGSLTLWNSNSPLFDLLIIWSVGLHLILLGRLCTRISYPHFRKMDISWLMLNTISTSLICGAIIVITFH